MGCALLVLYEVNADNYFTTRFSQFSSGGMRLLGVCVQGGGRRRGVNAGYSVGLVQTLTDLCFQIVSNGNMDYHYFE